ncbi:MAG: carboxypeptidase-like regulatory domain-containing protein, partial [Pyrinomonadaceae bacterium]
MSFRVIRSKFFLTLLTVVFSVTLIGEINAQTGTTKISGLVKDQQEATVPGATVTLTNPNTGFTRTTTTNNSGIYIFPGIPSGTYQIEISANNFKKSIVREVQALVDNPIEVNVALELGDVAAVVDVTSNTIESVVNTQDATIGNNFVPDQITQLPTDLRRINGLLSLQPGVTKEGYVNGGRSDQANITLDGIDVNDQQTGEAFSSVLRVTTEAVEEFRITTTNPNANQGRSSGAQISLVTKSGSNSFHGVGFGFYRPTALSANNFFNNLAGVERPILARKVFGGAIGGPIKKDRAFFFYSYEGQRQQLGVPVVRTVPLAHLGQGQLKFFGTDTNGNTGLITLTTAQLNAIFPAVGINPAAVAVFADAANRYAANDITAGDGINTGGFRFNSPTSVSENTHIARFDFNLNDKQSLFFRGSYQFDNAVGTSYFPDTQPTTFWDHPYGFVVGHNWTISNDKVNNFRYGLTRQSFTRGGDSNENAISFRFVYQPSFFARTVSRRTPVQNITDDFTMIAGQHTIQFGGNVRIVRNNRVGLGSSYDSAVANPSFYASSGRVLDRPITAAGYTIGSGQRT